MSDTIWLIVIAGGLLFLLILKKIAGARHWIRSAVFSMILGVMALAAVNLSAPVTAVSIPVSRLSLAASAFLGIPGVTAMLLLQVFF